ncbi:unnamed protein product [Leptidea sinapis]|uniref:USP domain-containing protein n=1 Tax=Leptidea sinapis TaxID=189913 RepID=A0A5E4Q9C6_9NEOP|nr:unnamed protein product [Leptidea sinapis]
MKIAVYKPKLERLFGAAVGRGEARLSDDVSQYPTISQNELEVVLNYIHSWPQRQCMCCYRDVKNYERFYLVIQSIICLSVYQLKLLKDEVVSASNKTPPVSDIKENEIVSSRSDIEIDEKESSDLTVESEKSLSNDQSQDDIQIDKPSTSTNVEVWTTQQRERLLHIVSKVFLLHFPLYLVCKHSILNRLDDLSSLEISNLSSYCDLHDTEIPPYLLRNVNLFCKLGGVTSMLTVFEHANSSSLPVSLAHAIVATIGNLKIWLNFRMVTQYFWPLRSKILQYMCGLEDKDLRVPAVKSMADFMWGAAKEPIESPLSIDLDGLALAFKYFNSSTLTMRLAGIAQINAHIAAHNELCAGDLASDAEIAGQKLATWLTAYEIIEHLFGPNLHVEVIKQSHMILKFLAVEGRVTPEHIELVWAAAQLKHCGRQVYDLLPGFIRALSPKPCSHLYSLLCSLPPKEHTEQSLYLASALMRAMWSRGRTGVSGGVSSPVGEPPRLPPPACKPHRSSSEASVSMDQTNSDEDPEWLREGEELAKKTCQKRSKRAGSSGSASSGAEEMLRPRKKKLYKKRQKTGKSRHFPPPMKNSELAESVSEVEEESSGSETAHCQLICDSVDARRLMELRLLESYKRRSEEENSVSSPTSTHSHRHLPDLDEDDSACEEELARLAAQSRARGSGRYRSTWTTCAGPATRSSGTCCKMAPFLTVDQVEELWQCLVVEGGSECADCLYSWLLSHTKSPEQHALGLDALRFLYVEKMPTLDPEIQGEDAVTSLATDGPLRMITQGQELTIDYDERTLFDMGFKDNQEMVAHMKAQLQSRRVWDILQAVPLNPTLLEAFQNPTEGKLPELLDPTSPQKLMYSLHIIDKLSLCNGNPNMKETSAVITNIEETEEQANVVQHAMRLCVVWARGGACGAARGGSLAWALRKAAPRLLLDDADPAVRREAGSALYRLCAGGQVSVLAPMLHLLLQHLPRAADMRPHALPLHHHEAVHHHTEEGKEPYGPACRDYFWLVCRLIDGLPEDYFKEGALTEDSGAPDLNELCEQLSTSLEKREIIEKRGEPCVPDDGLYGQLSLLTHLLKHPLPFKTSEQGTRCLEAVFGFLFYVPNPNQRNLPKCKSQKSRAAAYDLLIELVRGAPDNYMILYDKLMEHHKPAGDSVYPWDYWPAEESRSECGHVGLTNLGATCYMASCMQHLYMMPRARAAVLRAQPARSRHAPVLREMQRMFAYLTESERKAYNPRSFCKVYQMDHQPLNTGEQKDMAEFFIDLVSKIEEMTPELKNLVKTLFCGVLSNNVVSLVSIIVKLLEHITSTINTESVNVNSTSLTFYTLSESNSTFFIEEKRKSAELKKDGDQNNDTDESPDEEYYEEIHHDRWLLFNDAEVKVFDAAHLAAECFGGEMTSKTYDSVTDKFMDFSFEKTNSAYMLFYELSPPQNQRSSESGQQEEPQVIFMGQMCSSVPQSLLTLRPEITEVAARLSTSFFIETFIHAKEKVLIKCPNQMVRQMFQRLCMHVIQRLRSSHCALYLQGSEDGDNSKLGEASCVTKFIRMLLSLMESGARSHLRHLTEYFSLLHEFSKMGEEEGRFMLRANAISTMINFYLGHHSTQQIESPTEEAGSSSSSGHAEAGDKLRPGALDKMVALVAGLGFPFIYQQTRDCMNLQQTRSLIFALCRWNEPLAQKIVNMIFQAIAKHSELITLLVEGSGSGSGSTAGLPCFTQPVLSRLWDLSDTCPHAALEWLAMQAAHAWALRTADRWVEAQLLASGAGRVRAAAALLLVALVPSQHFRAGYGRARAHSAAHSPAHAKLPDTAHHSLHQFGQYFNDLWDLYHPGISEPSVAVHPNKQALITFWHTVCVDCPENVQLIVSNPRVVKHIGFNYILADHDDGEVVSYNRAMLPAYYALLRLCARRSGSFARSLAQHQNLHWAFRNIAPHAHLYPSAADELLREGRPGGACRRYQGLNGRTSWSTLISAFCTLVENGDDRLYVVYNGGLQMTFEALHSLHAVYVEGGAGSGPAASGVRGELTGALRWARSLCRTLRARRDHQEARSLLLACKDWPECARRLLTLLTLHQRSAALAHAALDTCCRVARSQRCMSEQLVLLSVLCALEAMHLRFSYFAAFWRDVANTPADAKLEELLLECSALSEYIDAILLDERDSLEDPNIYEFMQHYYPKVCSMKLCGASTSAAGAASAAESLYEDNVEAESSVEPVPRCPTPEESEPEDTLDVPPDTDESQDDESPPPPRGPAGALLRGAVAALAARVTQHTPQSRGDQDSAHEAVD